MHTINTVDAMPSDWVGCVATMGNFDGVHQGHKALLRRTVLRAQALGVPSLALLFEPQPYEFFSPHQPCQRLMRLKEKYHAIKDCGLDHLLCLPFDRAMAAMPAQVFIEHWLVGHLGIRGIVIGDDCRFGAHRHGHVGLLKAQGKQQHFFVEVLEDVCVHGRRASSTAVRGYLAKGDCASAAQILGAPYYLMGHVVSGMQLGRQLGFPTANIPIHGIHSGIDGVYVAQVLLLDGGPSSPEPSVISLGTRPTVNGEDRLLEVHLLDAHPSVDLYGKQLKVSFLEKIRNQACFDNLAALKSQMCQDKVVAVNYFVNVGLEKKN